MVGKFVVISLALGHPLQLDIGLKDGTLKSQCGSWFLIPDGAEQTLFPKTGVYIRKNNLDMFRGKTM